MSKHMIPAYLTVFLATAASEAGAKAEVIEEKFNTIISDLLLPEFKEGQFISVLREFGRKNSSTRSSNYYETVSSVNGRKTITKTGLKILSKMTNIDEGKTLPISKILTESQVSDLKVYWTVSGLNAEEQTHLLNYTVDIHKDYLKTAYMIANGIKSKASAILDETVEVPAPVTKSKLRFNFSPNPSNGYAIITKSAEEVSSKSTRPASTNKFIVTVTSTSDKIAALNGISKFEGTIAVRGPESQYVHEFGNYEAAKHCETIYTSILNLSEYSVFGPIEINF